MNLFERRRVASATVDLHVGRLPANGERVPHVAMPQVRVRALSPSWYLRDRVVREGEVHLVDSDEAAGLIQRKLAELVP
jgi:hypothetical protein